MYKYDDPIKKQKKDWLRKRSVELSYQSTPAEKRMYQIFESLGIKYISQKVVGVTGIADAYLPELRCFFEADGYYHYTSEGIKRDIKRDSRFGGKVHRFENKFIINEYERFVLHILNLIKVRFEIFYKLNRIGSRQCVELQGNLRIPKDLCNNDTVIDLIYSIKKMKLVNNFIVDYSSKKSFKGSR